MSANGEQLIATIRNDTRNKIDLLIEADGWHDGDKASTAFVLRIWKVGAGDDLKVWCKTIRLSTDEATKLGVMLASAVEGVKAGHL